MVYVERDKAKKLFPKARKRDRKGKFTKELPWRYVAYLFIMAGVFAMTNFALERYVDWRQKWDVVYTFPVEVALHKPVDVVEREIEWISPVVVVEEADIEVETPLDQKILDLWGEKYFLLARSVFKCESGLNPEAVNWGSKDIGIAQINWPIWEKPVQEQFGYTLVDMFDVDKNLEVAHWIWDRDGDGVGSFRPWVVYNGGNFVNCIE